MLAAGVVPVLVGEPVDGLPVEPESFDAGPEEAPDPGPEPPVPADVLPVAGAAGVATPAEIRGR